MRRDVGTTVLAILIAGVGIGSASTVFSVINALLLRPLPYKDPGSLVAFRSLNLQSGESFGVSPADYLDWQQQTQAFEPIALYSLAVSASRHGTSGGGPWGARID
jgi:hypothetical protein